MSSRPRRSAASRILGGKANDNEQSPAKEIITAPSAVKSPAFDGALYRVLNIKRSFNSFPLQGIRVLSGILNSQADVKYLTGVERIFPNVGYKGK